MTKFKIFSMFDGVGGFIVGLNNANNHFKSKLFQISYINQFEPSRKSQDAFEVGVYNFPSINHSNEDITKVSNSYFKEMKINGVNLIVGGFPCQDYSVARSKKNESGITGKKGVLFWAIIKAVKYIKPEYLILENVDRLLKSPSAQRGRDFAIMLGAFNQLGYSVEWRVINAADYGRAQRRRRVFFFVYRNDTSFAKKIDKKFEVKNKKEKNKKKFSFNQYRNYIFSDGLFPRQFPIKKNFIKNRNSIKNLSKINSKSKEYIIDISNKFTGTFWNSGIMRYGKYFTAATEAIKESPKTLGDIVAEAKKYYVNAYGKKAYTNYIKNFVVKDKEKIEKFKYLRSAKKIKRVTKEGYQWTYSEGGMSEFDNLNLPARTMLTSEGTINRSSHILKYKKFFRLLTPIESELIQDFNPDWTKYKLQKDGTIKEVSARMRLFFMGNALVTKIVERVGVELVKIANNLNTKKELTKNIKKKQ